MKKSSLFIGLFIAVLIGIAIIGFSKVSQANAKITEGSDNYTISETWELPDELDEISGIVWIDDHTLACVQDENGIIYLYDLDEKSIREEIPFSGNGDYEGIALHKTDLYVMQSDGLLYEIKDWRETNRTISSYQTGFKAANNMESLTYSAKDSSLLTAPKDKDANDEFKGIYKISMTSKRVDVNSPTYKIEMNAEALKNYRDKKLRKTFNPSEIAVHPKTNDIYVLEGKNPKLLILDEHGNLKNVYKLDEINFPQPEGMTFSADGDLYISNEAVIGAATIHLVDFKML
ncbi:SdiA-regulated domain-containing protein [Gelidibacter pelagius]|uniref:SdiA-regulated domain-containing protein n=1 Tax=Gelidibacter pelagius TaxID=2819985 RepID=A0ABS3SRU0_9FLAO|nr:SdiA-regulated domain-containing protein [Gelidibacter pelagius]MBO3098146.1 SdiA-regulated domain-containing protein [Gelidibacter pelagius]